VKTDLNQKEPTVFMKGTSGLFMQLFRNSDYIPFGGGVEGVPISNNCPRVGYALPIGVNYDDQFFFFGELHEWKISYFLSVVEPVLAGYHIFKAHLRIPVRHILFFKKLRERYALKISAIYLSTWIWIQVQFFFPSLEMEILSVLKIKLTMNACKGYAYENLDDHHFFSITH
jgi:hypothetical protein